MPVPQQVAAAYADIQAIQADGTLTDAQKSFAIRSRRATALSDQFGVSLQISKTVIINPWSITVDSVLLALGRVELFGVVVRKNNVDVGLDPHQIFANPPLLFPDDTGAIVLDQRPGKWRVDPAAVILNELISQAIDKVGP